MVLAQLGADRDDGDALRLFLASLDLQEFSRIFEDENFTLEHLQNASDKELRVSEMLFIS